MSVAHVDMSHAQQATAQASASGQGGETAWGSPEIALDTVSVTGAGEMATAGYQPITNSSATRTNMLILDIPQAVNVVSQEVINDQQDRTLDEVLRNVSNVTQANTLAGTQDAFIRRGFGDNRDGSVLTNGLRTVLPRSFNATTDRVEVLKGPASTLYGIQEPGGIINVITKKPQDVFGSSFELSGTSFGGGYGTFDITGPIANTNLAYRLIGEWQDNDYWRNYGEVKQNLIAPSLGWHGENTSVDVSYTHREYTVPFDRGTIFDPTTGKAVTTDRRIQFTEPYNITNGQSDLVLVNASHNFNDKWKLKVDYAYSHDSYSDNQARVMAYDPATGNLTRRADSTNGSYQTQHNVRADLSGEFTVAGFKNELLVGAAYSDYDLLRTDMIRCPNTTGFNIYRPVYGTLAKCTRVSAADSDQTIQQSVYSGYIQDALYLTDQWILVGGVSFQQYTQYAGKGRPFNANTDSDGTSVNPRAGIVYKLTPDISLYANFATGFVPQSSIADNIGSLPPEESVSYEAGAKFELMNGLTATAAIFNIEKKNVLYNETLSNGDTVARTAGKVRSQGFEFDMAGRLTDRINIIASYGYQDVKVVEDPTYAGNSPVNVSPYTASMFMTYDVGRVLGDDNLKIGGGFSAQGKRAGDAANSFYLPGYAVFDAMMAYTINVKNPMTIQLNVKNLFDTTYYTSSIGNNLGVAIGAPMEAVLSARVKF
ncbi:TonB-dependent receptor [Azorhizobium oxalatiphilum]|uniref:TonB-dependent receptor n=1 Tax=Azorhizobium oxalatiphilum TaxID=980631 RepID=A0A917C4Q2_9HYPH|nr:TonB-dependent siderophore receptor [Azorhizobium oxalatiphilum]GGF68794.1 TonB-dependent receptor [Azorhizobium oxalatiphilum]